MEFIYFNKHTITSFPIDIGIKSTENVDDTINLAAKHFFSELYENENNESTIELIYSINAFEVISKDRHNNHEEWLRPLLFIKTDKPKFFADIETNEMFTLHAEGIQGSLFISEDDQYVKVNFLSKKSINFRLTEIDDPSLFRRVEDPEVIANINNLKFLNAK